MRIIDSAVRFSSDVASHTVDTYRQAMASCSIDHAVIAPGDNCVTVYNEEGNVQTAEIIKTHPDLFSGLAVANPWYGPKAVDILKRAFDGGLRGLYLHPLRQGFRLTEGIIDPLIDVCLAYGRAVYSHTGTPIVCEPFQLAELARRFPDVRFVMGHGAYPDFWYDVSSAMTQSPNLYIETSCQVGVVLQQVLDTVGADRVLFGSGFPRSQPGLEIDKIKRLRLNTENLAKVAAENAKRLWGIKR
ncbi:MAG: amidohydrolase family protein [Phycisphaerae bacterium]